MDRTTESNFGELLKHWRTERRMSQIDLGLLANVSARHISFLESGRANPSRSMVIQLSDAAQIPRASRNTLLKAAGFAEAYRSRDLNDQEMTHLREAIDWTLQRHDPFPALALDRHWMIVKANVSATQLLGSVGVAAGDSLLVALTKSERLRSAIENWAEVARFFVTRLCTESAQLGGDEKLIEAAKALASYCDADYPISSSAVVPTRYKFDGTVLSLVSTLAQFGTAEDIALADLKIELMFPADAATRAFLMTGRDKARTFPA
jgi:transcriptional regulator with XRE-family HTH domain